MKNLLLVTVFWLFFFSIAKAESTVVPFFDVENGNEPWVTNLTPKGTHLLKNLDNSGYDSIKPYDNFDVISLFGFKYFAANKALYRTDTTAKRTKIENNVSNVRITNLVKYKNRIYLSYYAKPNQIVRVTPKGPMNFEDFLIYDQQKAKRRVLSFKSGAYDNKMIVLIFSSPSKNPKSSYDLRLANGQRGWSQILNYKYANGLSNANTLNRVYVTDRYIFFSDTRGRIWRTKNTSRPPKIAILDQYKLPNKERIIGTTIINDKHFLYFATAQGNIYRTDGSQKRTRRVNKKRFPDGKIVNISSVFKNHLILQGSKDYTTAGLMGERKKTLYSINLQNGKWRRLAESIEATSHPSPPLILPPPLLIKK